MSQCELVNRENSTQGSPHMSSFNLKQQEIAGEEVHRNILPSSHYKHGILYDRIGVSAEVKNAGPVA